MLIDQFTLTSELVWGKALLYDLEHLNQVPTGEHPELQVSLKVDTNYSISLET